MAMTKLTEQMNEKIAVLIRSKKRKMNIRLSPFEKVCIFILSTFVIVFGVAIYLFLSLLQKTFFNVLIGWKGLSLGSLAVMFAKFVAVVGQLVVALHVPTILIQIFVYPFSLIYQVADFTNVDLLYELLTVTCQGAKAPIELFIDSFVLGVAVLFIRSNYSVLWSLTLQEMNKSITVKYWIDSEKLLTYDFILSAIAFVITAANPFISILRFFLSFVNFAAFFAEHYVTHSLSPACIGIAGYENQELWLVDATSVLVWWLIAPMLYITAEIVCPRGGYTASKSEVMSWFRSRRGVVPVTPLPSQPIVSTDDNFRNNNCSNNGSYSANQDNNNNDDNTNIIKYNSNDDDDKEDEDIYGDLSDFSGSDISRDDSLGSVDISDLRSSEISMSDIEISSDEESSLVMEEEDNDYDDNDGDDDDDDERALNSRRAGMTSRTGKVKNSRSEEIRIADRSKYLHFTCLTISGMFRYAWSYAIMIGSADLLIVYVIKSWVAHCQKLNQLELLRQRRSHQRWDARKIEQSFAQLRAMNKKGRRLNRPVEFYYKYELSARESKRQRDAQWREFLSKPELPSYFRLCFKEQQELQRQMSNRNRLYCLLSLPVSIVLVLCGVGHVVTSVGRTHWEIVLRKYWLFACVSLGIWTDEAFEAYDVEDLLANYTNREGEEVAIQLIPLIVASRAILLQALGGTTTLISIVIINMCSSPLFVFSSRMRAIIPPLLHRNPREEALKRERIEQLGQRHTELLDAPIHVEEWAMKLLSLSVFLTDSRLMVFFANLVSLILAIVILEDIQLSSGFLTLLLLCILPYFVGSALIPIVYVGKRLNLTDSDFEIGLSKLQATFRIYLSHRKVFHTPVFDGQQQPISYETDDAVGEGSSYCRGVLFANPNLSNDCFEAESARNYNLNDEGSDLSSSMFSGFSIEDIASEINSESILSHDQYKNHCTGTTSRTINPLEDAEPIGDVFWKIRENKLIAERNIKQPLTSQAQTPPPNYPIGSNQLNEGESCATDNVENSNPSIHEEEGLPSRRLDLNGCDGTTGNREVDLQQKNDEGSDVFQTKDSNIFSGMEVGLADNSPILDDKSVLTSLIDDGEVGSLYSGSSEPPSPSMSLPSPSPSPSQAPPDDWSVSLDGEGFADHLINNSDIGLELDDQYGRDYSDNLSPSLPPSQAPPDDWSVTLDGEGFADHQINNSDSGKELDDQYGRGYSGNLSSSPSPSQGHPDDWSGSLSNDNIADHVLNNTDSGLELDSRHRSDVVSNLSPSPSPSEEPVDDWSVSLDGESVADYPIFTADSGLELNDQDTVDIGCGEVFQNNFEAKSSEESELGR